MGNTHCLLSTLPNSSEETSQVWASPVRGTSVQVTGLSGDEDGSVEHRKVRAGRPAADDVQAEAGVPLPASGRSPSGVFFLNLDGRHQDYDDPTDAADRAQNWWCPRCRCEVVQEFDEHRGIVFRACPSCRRWERLGSDPVPGEFHGDDGADFGDDLEADGDLRGECFDDVGEAYEGDGRGGAGGPLPGDDDDLAEAADRGDGLDPRYYGGYGGRDVRECPFCRDLVEVSHLHAHVETCPQNVRQCPFCTDDVQAHGFHEHVARCAEGVGPVCPFCRRTMQARELHQHVPRCPMNTRRCPFCSEEVRADLFHSHVPRCQQRSREADLDFDDLGACGDHEEYDLYEHPQDAFAGGAGEQEDGSDDGSLGSDGMEEMFSSGSWEGGEEDEGFHDAYRPAGGAMPEDGRRFDGRGAMPEDGRRFDGRGGDAGAEAEDEALASVCPAAAQVIAQVRQDLRGLESAALKSKLRRLQLKWHPDKAKGDPAVVHDVFCFVQAEWERNFG